jgi:quercetin dioxygenase-like cupin family protein
MADNKTNANDEVVIDFAAMPWESPARGVRVKQVLRGIHRIRLVEFSEDFTEADWCIKGHIGFVIDGSLEVDFDGRIVELHPGNGLFIPPGEASKHKACVRRGKATLFVVENTAGQ